jgi:hypothetical protein
MRELQFKLTRDDLVDAFHAHRRTSRLFHVFFFPPLGIVFLAIGLIGLAAHWQFCMIPLCMGLFWIVGIPLITNITLRSALASRPRQSQTISITASADGLEIWTKDADGREKWSEYVAYIETPLLFLCYFTSRVYRPIPKRAFRSEADINEFRKLVIEKIGTVRKGWLF